MKLTRGPAEAIRLLRSESITDPSPLLQADPSSIRASVLCILFFFT